MYLYFIISNITTETNKHEFARTIGSPSKLSSNKNRLLIFKVFNYKLYNRCTGMSLCLVNFVKIVPKKN